MMPVGLSAFIYLEPGKTKWDAKAVGTDRHQSTHMNTSRQLAKQRKKKKKI